MEMRRRGDGEHRQKEENCESIIVKIAEDGRMRAREDEKVEKYQNLASDVTGMCAVRTLHYFSSLLKETHVIYISTRKSYFIDRKC